MGQQIKLRGVHFPASLPILRADSVMSNGSLFLFDFGREDCFPLSSVPTNGDTIKNLAVETAVGLIGSGDMETLGATFENTVAGFPAQGSVTRSTKYGINIIVTQTAQDPVGRHAGIVGSAPLRDYIFNNALTHAFYFSTWTRLTRPATTGGTGNAYFANTSSPVNYYDFVFGWPPSFKPDNSNPNYLGGRCFPNSNSIGNMFRNVAANAWTGTHGSASSHALRFWFGSQAGYTFLDQNKAASGIIYRAYGEDLTVSGRTYAEVDAIDKAMFDSAFGTGGRFSGDTFTAASTIL